MEAPARMNPDLGALAIIIEEQARRRHAHARRETDLSSPKSSMAWLMPGGQQWDSSSNKPRPTPSSLSTSTTGSPSPSSSSTSTSSSTSPISPSPSPSPIPGALPGESLPDMLLRLSRAGADMFNTRGFETHWVRGYYTADFRASGAPGRPDDEWMDWAAWTGHFRAIVADGCPRLHFTVTEGTASVVDGDDEGRGNGGGDDDGGGGGVARVFQNVEITGQSPGMVGHEMVVLEWRRQSDGGWKCAEFVGLRGLAGWANY